MLYVALLMGIVAIVISDKLTKRLNYQAFGG